METTTLTTIIGDQIEKFSQPTRPIYRIEYIQSRAELDDDGVLGIKTAWKSMVGELMPLNEEDLKEKAKFDKWKTEHLKQERTLIKPTDEWENDIEYCCDTNSTEVYVEGMLGERGMLHIKLLNHIKKTLKKPFTSPLPVSYGGCCGHKSFVFIKLEKLA